MVKGYDGTKNGDERVFLDTYPESLDVLNMKYFQALVYHLTELCILVRLIKVDKVANRKRKSSAASRRALYNMLK